MLSESGPVPTSGLGRHDRQELPRTEDDDVPVAPEGKEVLIAGHEIVCASGCSASHEVVIVRVAADSGGSNMRKRKSVQAEELEEPFSIPWGNRVLLPDLGTAQNLSHLLDLPWRQQE
jgi:hypothetical protein